MFNIYKYCKKCIVLPGGLSRLVPLDEPTSWIHRAWTLQEAIAPNESVCLFAWDQGDCILQTHMGIGVTEIQPGVAAQAGLHDLLSISLSQTVRIVKPPTWSYDTDETIRLRNLADSHEDNQIIALLGAIEYRGKEGMENAIWRASLMRVASRPADSIFSIMGILGVDLNPLQFDANDRFAPTIALMTALLAKGDRAEWLGAAPDVDINPHIATLPKFPQISPQGRALMESKDGLVPISDAMGDTWWRLVGAPRGEMLDDGTLKLKVQVLSVSKKSAADESFPALDSVLEIRPGGFDRSTGAPLSTEMWYPPPMGSGPPYILKLGLKEFYQNAARAMVLDPRPWLIMLVDACEDGKFRNFAYASVSQELADMPGWRERTIALTGG